MLEFLEGGVSLLVGSRDDALRPDCQRGLGLRIEGQPGTLTVFLHGELGVQARANFEANGVIAVTAARIADHHTLQLKGRVLDVTAATEDDLPLQEGYRAALAESLALAGLARSVVRRLRLRPGLAVRFEVFEAFDQTPGVGAGRRMEIA